MRKKKRQQTLNLSEAKYPLIVGGLVFSFGLFFTAWPILATLLFTTAASLFTFLGVDAVKSISGTVDSAKKMINETKKAVKSKRKKDVAKNEEKILKKPVIVRLEQTPPKKTAVKLRKKKRLNSGKQILKAGRLNALRKGFRIPMAPPQYDEPEDELEDLEIQADEFVDNDELNTENRHEVADHEAELSDHEEDVAPALQQPAPQQPALQQPAPQQPAPQQPAPQQPARRRRRQRQPERTWLGAVVNKLSLGALDPKILHKSKPRINRRPAIDAIYNVIVTDHPEWLRERFSQEEIDMHWQTQPQFIERDRRVWNPQTLFAIHSNPDRWPFVIEDGERMIQERSAQAQNANAPAPVEEEPERYDWMGYPM